MNQSYPLASKAKENLNIFRKRFNPIIENYFESVISDLDKSLPNEIVLINEVFKDILTRDAKRLRASFIYYSNKLFNGQDEENALNLGIIVEITHAYLLFIDDYMDKSEMRRGKLTAHKLFQKDFVEKSLRGDSEHFGNSIAVTAGIMGFHIAMLYLSRLDLDPEIKNKISNNLNKRIIETSWGQVIDVYNASKPQVTEREVLKMLELKTGVYTYENPILVGAIIAGQNDEKVIDALKNYSISGGIAFQIVDDILGVFGIPDETGKSNLEDIKEGKYTLLVHEALTKGSKSQVDKLRSHLGNKDLTISDHEDLKQIFIDTGAYDYCRSKAVELMENANSSLLSVKTSDWDGEALDYLIGINQYILERKS